MCGRNETKNGHIDDQNKSRKQNKTKQKTAYSSSSDGKRHDKMCIRMYHTYHLSTEATDSSTKRSSFQLRPKIPKKPETKKRQQPHMTKTADGSDGSHPVRPQAPAISSAASAATTRRVHRGTRMREPQTADFAVLSPPSLCLYQHPIYHRACMHPSLPKLGVVGQAHGFLQQVDNKRTYKHTHAPPRLFRPTW